MGYYSPLSSKFQRLFTLEYDESGSEEPPRHKNPNTHSTYQARKNQPRDKLPDLVSTNINVILDQSVNIVEVRRAK